MSNSKDTRLQESRSSEKRKYLDGVGVVNKNFSIIALARYHGSHIPLIPVTIVSNVYDVQKIAEDDTLTKFFAQKSVTEVSEEIIFDVSKDCSGGAASRC
jgi:hypothetical protein